MGEPFSFDVWTNSPPKHANTKHDVDQMAQAMLSRLNSNPGGGLPANYNSHVYRVIQSHGELQNTVDDLKRKLEESDLVSKHLRLQLDVLEPKRKRSGSGASKASWEYLREQSEQPSKSLLEAELPKLDKSLASENPTTKSPKRAVNISPKPSFKSAESVVLPSTASLPLSYDEFTTRLAKSKAEGVATSSTNTNGQSGDILSTMYHLAGLMVVKRNINFHQAFYRIFSALYDKSSLKYSGTTTLYPKYHGGGDDTEGLPPLSELLEEACRLELEAATTQPDEDTDLSTHGLLQTSSSVTQHATQRLSAATSHEPGRDMSCSAHSDTAEVASVESTEQARMTRSEGDLNTVNSDTPYSKDNTPKKLSQHVGNLSDQGSPVRSPFARFYLPFDWRSKSPKHFHAKQSSDGSEASSNTVVHRSPPPPRK